MIVSVYSGQCSLELSLHCMYICSNAVKEEGSYYEVEKNLQDLSQVYIRGEGNISTGAYFRESTVCICV